MSLIVRARAITIKGKDLVQGDPVPKNIPADRLKELQAMGAVQDSSRPLPGRETIAATVADAVVPVVPVAPPEPEPYDAKEKTDGELLAWLVHVKPNAEDTIAAAGGDPDLAKRIASAEQQVEKPRKGVTDALGAITDKPPAWRAREMPLPSWAPGPDDVAALLQSRTSVDAGEGTAGFTEYTVPSLDLVLRLIEEAVAEVDDVIGFPIPERYQDEAARLATRRTAALVVLSHDDPTTERSPQERSYNAMWLEGIERLAARLRPPVFLA